MELERLTEQNPGRITGFSEVTDVTGDYTHDPAAFSARQGSAQVP
jgi:hypothetical protein